MDSQPDVIHSLTSEIKEKYLQVRAFTEEICKPLKTEDYVVQPIVDVSPPKWHLAHTTWFFEEFILKNAEGYQRYDEDFAFFFNSYYESVGKRVLRPNRGLMTRPGTEEIYRYRAYVDAEMEKYLQSEVSGEVLELLELGLNHEQQHQELLVTDLKYILGHNPLFPVYKESNDENRGDPGLNWLEIEEGIYEIGHNSQDFCFDNELGRHKTYIQSFRAMDRLVTNREFMEFIADGGYEDFRWWLSEGWDWTKSLETRAPMYWHMVDGAWHNYKLSGFEAVNPDQPVTHISFFEADAYANWKGKRLLTEFEWEVLESRYSGEAQEGFADEGHFHPQVREAGRTQLLGHTWEWTNSAYLPYPGFEKAPGAVGEYNGKFMINQMVLRGGSCATSRNHIRNTYRNFFHPHLRWQFTGIRLAE